MERRIFKIDLAPVSLSKRADESPVIEGHGAVFYDGTEATEYELWRGVKERVMPGAFNRSLAEAQDVRGLFNHDPNLILGRTSAGTMTLKVDKRGLRYEIEPGDTTVAKDVMSHLKRKDVTGSSFSFRVVKEAWIKREDGTEIREIHDVDLYDVGPVTFPAYPGSDSSVRTEDVEVAKRSLSEFREREKQQHELKATLASYRQRAERVQN